MEPEAAEMASRHRSLGNIKFIGELYKLQVSMCVCEHCLSKVVCDYVNSI